MNTVCVWNWWNQRNLRSRFKATIQNTTAMSVVQTTLKKEQEEKKQRNMEHTHIERRLMCACLFIIHFIFTYHSLLCARWNEALHLYKFWLVYMLPWQSWFTAIHVHNSKHNRRHIRKPHFFVPSTAFKYSIVLNFIYHVLKLYFIKKIVGIKRFLKLIFDFFVSFGSLCYDCMPMLTNAWYYILHSVY